jgi:hypothetical protein
MATYYVTTSGSDSNNGLTEGTAFATPGYAASVATTIGDKIWVKAGTYNLTSTSTNVSGGAISLSDRVDMEGYDSTTGDRAARPLLYGNSLSGTTMISYGTSLRGVSDTATVANIDLDGTTTWSNGLVTTGALVVTSDCFAKNFNVAFNGSSFFIKCKATSNTGYDFLSGKFFSCFSYSSRIGFYQPNLCQGCIVADASYIGFRQQNTTCFDCIAYNSVTGFTTPSNQEIHAFVRCIAVNNSTKGFDNYCSPMIQCAAYNNGTDLNETDPTKAVTFGNITLSADPFTDAANGDFTLNSDAGGGELLKNVQWTHASGVTSYYDVGTYQRQVTSGGGGGGSFTPTAGTQVYPFRQFVSDKFGAVLHPLRSN